MNNTIIYEATNGITPFSIPFAIFCLIFLIVIAYALKVWKKSELGVKIGLVLVPAVMSIVLIAQFATFFQTKQVLDSYIKGDCEIVEGEISNYEQKYEVGTMSEDKYPDRFFVNNIEFIVYGYQTYGIEYCLRQADGSKLENGQSVKIYYTKFKYENLILKIELTDS